MTGFSSDVITTAEHQPQDAQQPSWHGTSGKGRRKRITWSTGLSVWLGSLVSAGTMFGALIWLFLFSPRQTPVFHITATAYGRPMQPLAWSAEDAARLKQLEGETISLHGTDAPIKNKDHFFSVLEEAAEATAGNQSKIIWIGMHGVTDPATGEAYLIPPQSNPLKSSTWIKLSEALRQLNEAQSAGRTLLILDCKRMDSNWSIGMTSNSFVRRVKETVQSEGINKLSILMPCDEGQVSLASEPLQATVFAHFTHLGLAGAADRFESGNQDGWVSLKELLAFTQKQTRNWANANRGLSQEPVLITQRDPASYKLIRSLRPTTVDSLVFENSQVGAADSGINDAQLDQLWQQVDALRKAELYQAEPVAFADIEQSLLWLEAASVAGDAYRSLALDKHTELSEHLAGIEARRTAELASSSVNKWTSTISGKPYLPKAHHAHSVDMARLLGTESFATLLDISEEIETISTNVDAGTVRDAIKSLSQAASDEFASTRFLRMIDRYQTKETWSHAAAIGRLMQLQSALAEQSVPSASRGGLRQGVWDRAMLNQVDSSRRLAEDRLFVNKSFDEQLATLDRSLAKMTEANENLEAAFSISDRINAEYLYLIQWFNESHLPLPEIQLIDELAKLSDQLTNPGLLNDGNSSRNSLDDLLEATASVFKDAEIAERRYAKVKRQFRSVSAGLAQSGRRLEPLQIGDCYAAMKVPFLSWGQRSKIRKSVKESALRLQQSYLTEDSVSVPANPQAQLSSHRGGTQASTADPLERLSVNAADTEVYAILKTDVAFMDDQLSEARRGNSIFSRRTNTMNVANHARKIAPLICSYGGERVIQALARCELQATLLWHAERALDDFWGTAGEEASFFSFVSENYIDAATVLETILNADGPPISEISRLENRLTAARELAANWIRTDAGTAIQFGPKQPAEASVLLSNGLDASLQSPEGIAGVTLRKSDGEEDAGEVIKPKPVELPILGTEVSITVPVELTGKRSLTAQTIFRGHEYNGELIVAPLGGLRVETEFPPAEKTRITLSGKSNEASFILVLDCSASMGESLGMDAKGRSKMEVAQAALQDLLLDLGLRSNARVGLRFFGSRVGWSKNKPPLRIARPGANPISADLFPSRDVESIFPLGEFSFSDAQRLIGKVVEAKPWGQSPLYLSILNSIEEFQSETSQSDCHVIVITDGGNYQFVPDPEAGDESGIDDIHASLNNSDIPISILGFEVAETSEAATLAELSKLCSDTGGEFISLARPIDLSETLNRLTKPRSYRVTPADDASLAREASMGDSVSVSLASNAKRTYIVEASSRSEEFAIREDVTLEGGEFLQFYVDDQNERIHTYPYTINRVAEKQLVTSTGEPSNLFVRLHRPTRNQLGTVRFPVSWQRIDSESSKDQRWLSTRRPEGIWIEIQPIAMDPSGVSVPIGERYVFTDASYIQQRNVPLVELAAHDWPVDGSKAEIRVWTSMPNEAASGMQLRAPSDARQESETAGGWQKTVMLSDLENSSQVLPTGAMLRMQRFEGNATNPSTTIRLIVDGRSSDVGDLRDIGLNVVGDRPTRITRQFDSAIKMAVHTFAFDDRINPSTNIIVKNRTAQTSDALLLPDEPMQIEIDEASDFIPIGTTMRP